MVLEVILHSYSNEILMIVSKINMLIKEFEWKPQTQIHIPMNTWYFIKKPEICNAHEKYL